MQGGGDTLLLSQHCVFDIPDSGKRTCKPEATNCVFFYFLWRDPRTLPLAGSGRHPGFRKKNLKAGGEDFSFF